MSVINSRVTQIERISSSTMIKQRGYIHSMAPSADYEGFRDNVSGNATSVVVVGAGPSGLMLA